MDLSSLLAIAAQTPPGGEQASNPFNNLFPLIIIIFGLFYILILRPQKKAQQQEQEKRDSIKKGDRIKTVGGIYGTVTAVDTTNNTISVQVARNVDIDFDRNAISTVIKKDEDKAAS